MNNHIPIEDIAYRYYRYTGQSPEHSFWSFLDACGVGYDDKSLNEFYENMGDYFPEDMKFE